jgi:hypothetical protein
MSRLAIPAAVPGVYDVFTSPIKETAGFQGFIINKFNHFANPAQCPKGEA